MRQRKEHLEDHYNKALDCIDARERKAKEAKCFPCGPLLNQNTATAHEGLYYCGKCQANHMFTTVSPKMPEGFGGVWKGSEAKDGEKIVAEQRAKRTRLEQNEAAREKVAYDKAQKLAGEIKRIAGRMNGYYKIADSNVGSLLSLAEELAEVSEKYREALDNLMAKKPHHK
jgi:predicted  nucleic acid-binding Zn-ribbon protein